MNFANLTSTTRFDRSFLRLLSSPPASAMPDDSIQAHLDQQFRASCRNPAEEKLPLDGDPTLDQVGQVMCATTGPNDRAFAECIVASLPTLRPFAVSLTRSVEQAEDLVQETVLKAITKQEQF